MAKKRGPSPPPPPPSKRNPLTGGAGTSARAGVPSATTADPLAEVERALSILQGRHPEHARAERQTMEAVQARKVATDAASAAAEIQDRRRRILAAIVGVPTLIALAVLGRWGYERYQHGEAVGAALEPLLRPYLAHGFAEVARSVYAHPARLELAADGGTCFIALATNTAGDSRLRVDRGETSLSGEDSIAWCSCAPEHVIVTALAAPGGVSGVGGVGLVRIDGRSVGGMSALPFVEPRPKLLAEPDECSSDQLDGWLAHHAATMPAAKETFEADPRSKKLHAGGFTMVAGADPSSPFAIVAGTEDSCAIALSDTKQATLSLRLRTDARPLAHAAGSIAWCTAHAASATVWREGKGSVFVFAAPAKRIGGMVGLREIAGRAGLGEIEPWVATADLGADATSTLVAAGIAAPEINVARAAVGHARVVALSIESGAFAPDAHDSSSFACAPTLGPKARQSVCFESASFGWRPMGGVGEGAVAQAPMPFWMEIYAPIGDASLLRTELQLVALSRRLSSEGFEPTVEGVNELADGVDIVGRAGDSAIVAVGLAPEPPWAFPYSDGASWQLDGEPFFIATEPGAHARLTSTPRPSGSREARRTVVFRKSK